MLVSVQATEDTVITHKKMVIKHKRDCPIHSDSEASNEFGSPSKAIKKIFNEKTKSKLKKKKESSKKPSSSNLSLTRSGDYSQRGLFHFIHKAKYRLLNIKTCWHQVIIQTTTLLRSIWLNPI